MFDSKNKKSTVTLTALLVGILLLATAGSVGAVMLLHLQAETDIDQNTVGAENIVITTDVTGYADILDSVQFDTVTDYQNGATVTLYRAHAGYDLNNDGVKESALVTVPFSITVTPTGISDQGTFDLDITVTDFTPVSGLTYTMVLGAEFDQNDSTRMTNYVAMATQSNSATMYKALNTLNANPALYGWHLTGLPYDNLSVALFISGDADTNPGTTAGFTNYSTSNPVADGSIFTFVATSNE